MHTPRAELRLAPFFVLLGVAATAIAIAAGGNSAQTATPAGVASAAAWRGLVGSRSPVAGGQGFIVVLRTPSLAERVAAAGGAVDIEQEEAWTKLAIAAQKLLVARLALHGIVVRPAYSFARVLDGFSAALSSSAIPVVERDPDVAGVYPVRLAYPATLSAGGPGSAAAPVSDVDAALARAGIDGRGVTVAVLDTGIDAAVASPRGRVLPGIDVVGGDSGARPLADPGGPSRVEEHGTEMADLVGGIASAAAVLPIRVAGWQPDGFGHWAIFSRSDELIAGLDRAVDPNGDGDAHDAVRIALVALAEPFVAFADAPEARAVAGARALDTLVVAPAGNDGPAGASYGDVSAPGGASSALTVGAFDTRTTVADARVAVRDGLGSIVDGTMSLAGATAPRHELDLLVAAPRATRGAPPLVSFFTSAGGSIVAGRAALVPAGSAPGPAAARAAEAGASAVLLYGARTTLPAGALDEPIPIPVVSLPPRAGRAIRARLRAGGRVSVSLGPAGAAANAGEGRVARFSSSGLAFDGSVKPDVVAPGVALATVQAGGGRVTVNGSSGAAAVVAGTAALLAQARPSLHADALAGLLTGTAQPLAADAVTVQGAGAVDAGAALAGEAAAWPTTLAFGAGPHMRASFTLANLSSRTLDVGFAIRTQDEGAAALRFSVHPSYTRIAPGKSVRVDVGASAASRETGAATADGSVVANIAGGGTVRVPWAIGFAPTSIALIRSASLSSSAFPRSDRRPAVLTVDAGAVVQTAAGVEVRPLSRLDVDLSRFRGPSLGVLARLRDVLPGTYAFGLTGRGPVGEPLSPGRYVVTIVGYPVDGGQPSRRKLGFTLR